VFRLLIANGQALVSRLLTQLHAQIKILLSVLFQKHLVNVWQILIQPIGRHNLAWMFPTQLHLVLHKQQTVQLIHHHLNIVNSQVVTVSSIRYLAVSVH